MNLNRRFFISTAMYSIAAAGISPLLADDKVANTFNIDFTGDLDSTDSFQKLLDYCANKATQISNGFQKVALYITGIIRVSSTLVIDASKVNIIGPATIIFSNSNGFKPFGIILNSKGGSQAAYTNGVGSVFESVNFISQRKIDLFFASNSSSSSASNPSCLINVSQCRFTGFNRVFTNGKGGWGWNWDRCGFNGCSNLLYITSKPDTYERFTFSSCIWQNGGVAFYIDNPFGKIYWSNGSFDYCEAIATIKRGHLSVSGHLEYESRDSPIVTILDENATFLFSDGSIFIRKNKDKHYMFDQLNDNQVTIRDVHFISDSVNPDAAVLSNKKCQSAGLFFSDDNSMKIMTNKM